MSGYVPITVVNVFQQVGPTPSKLQRTGALVSQGATTLTAASGVTLNGVSGGTYTMSQNQSADLVQLQQDVWSVNTGGGASSAILVSSKTASYSLQSTDLGSLILFAPGCTTTYTLSLYKPSAGGIQPVYVKNGSTYPQTISGALNGASSGTYSLPPGGFTELVFDGTYWWTSGGSVDDTSWDGSSNWASTINSPSCRAVQAALLSLAIIATSVWGLPKTFAQGVGTSSAATGSGLSITTFSAGVQLATGIVNSNWSI